MACKRTCSRPVSRLSSADASGIPVRHHRLQSRASRRQEKGAGRERGLSIRHTCLGVPSFRFGSVCGATISLGPGGHLGRDGRKTSCAPRRMTGKVARRIACGRGAVISGVDGAEAAGGVDALRVSGGGEATDVTHPVSRWRSAPP